MNGQYVFGKLFAQPSFLEGMARVLDVGNTLKKYNESETGRAADVEALKNDWYAVGDDLRISISIYEQKQSPKTA